MFEDTTTENLTELAGAYGWNPIESKNKYMISFRRDENPERMNIYFTTMTVTIDKSDGMCAVYRGVSSLAAFEDILIKHQIPD